MVNDQLSLENKLLREENERLRKANRTYELRCYQIWAIGHDYDGYNIHEAEKMRAIIDELVSIASGKEDDELSICYDAD